MFDPILIFILLILIFSVIIHELAHGYVAYSEGDLTAKYADRLTLNPFKHIDMVGSIILPGFLLLASFLSNTQGIIFGWAKPVPVNPYNFKDQKWGSLKVAIAGPISNILLAVVFGLVIRLLQVNLFAAAPAFLLMCSYVVRINLILAMFNLLPIPPLDGSWILFQFLPPQFERLKFFLQQYGFFILIVLLFSGALDILHGIEALFFYLITGIPS